MSFIFDALKKSEAQRRQGSVPDLRMAHQAQTPPSAQWRPGLSLLLAILILNAAGLLWWLRPWETPARVTAAPAAVTVSKGAATGEERGIPAGEASVPRAEAESGTLAGKENEGDLRARPAPPPAGWMDFQAPTGAGSGRAPFESAAAPKPKRKAPAADRSGSVPHLDELPSAVRQTLPEIAISLHYYTAEPAARLARLNGKILREGERTDSGLVLEEITPSGVVLRQGEVRFHLGDF